MNTKESIVVAFPGKYGPNVNGVFYSIDPRSGVKPEQFEKGRAYDITFWTSKTGKKYINQIVGEGGAIINSAPAESISAQVVKETIEIIKELPGDDKILVDKPHIKKEVDWDKKTAQIQAQGCIQAAVQSPGLQLLLITDYKGYWENVERLAKDMLQFVQENS
jgi:hypothetical protein